MQVGYVHPYHTEGNPVYMSNMYFLRNLFNAVGPEQVSPHYESLSRSRRGLIFFGLYIGSIASISRLGGWDHNDWLRGMIFHHEYLICLFVGYSELRHFTFLVGPKFSVFYNVYSRYEYAQMANSWADEVEMIQTKHLSKTKEQLEYNRIDHEYEFIKKRALINFLTFSKLNAEANFHHRCVAMLNQIQNFEQSNLRNQMKEAAYGSLEKVLGELNNADTLERVKQASFESALAGIRSGQMKYEHDLVLPMI